MKYGCNNRGMYVVSPPCTPYSSAKRAQQQLVLTYPNRQDSGSQHLSLPTSHENGRQATHPGTQGVVVHTRRKFVRPTTGRAIPRTKLGMDGSSSAAATRARAETCPRQSSHCTWYGRGCVQVLVHAPYDWSGNALPPALASFPSPTRDRGCTGDWALEPLQGGSRA